MYVPAEEETAQTLILRGLTDRLLGVPTDSDILALTDFGLKAMSFEYFFLILHSTISPKKSCRRDGGYTDNLLLHCGVAASMKRIVNFSSELGSVLRLLVEQFYNVVVFPP